MIRLSAAMPWASLLLLLLIVASSSGSYGADIRLIVRGDDLGMTQGSLAAFEKAFNEGILTCASILVCAPWFEGAADLCRRNPTWCTGVHLALVGEWRGYRWRPVLPWDKVSSLVDEDGFLYAYPDELWKHNPKIEEIEAELRAQIKLALKKGLNIQYIDTHYMGPQDYPGLSEVIKKISLDYNLPISGSFGEKRVAGNIYRAPVEEKTAIAVKSLRELGPGLWLWVAHPGIDSPEQGALIHTEPGEVFKGGGVGKHRDAETKALSSAEVRSVINEKGIQLISYKDLSEKKQKGLEK